MINLLFKIQKLEEFGIINETKATFSKIIVEYKTNNFRVFTGELIC